MSRCGTEDPEERLSKVAEWVAVGIHVHVDAPDVPARNGSHQTKDRVERYTRPIASVGESPSKDWLVHSTHRKLGKVQSLLPHEWTVLTLRQWDQEYRW